MITIKVISEYSFCVKIPSPPEHTLNKNILTLNPDISILKSNTGLNSI